MLKDEMQDIIIANIIIDNQVVRLNMYLGEKLTYLYQHLTQVSSLEFAEGWPSLLAPAVQLT